MVSHIVNEIVGELALLICTETKQKQNTRNCSDKIIDTEDWVDLFIVRNKMFLWAITFVDALNDRLVQTRVLKTYSCQVDQTKLRLIDDNAAAISEPGIQLKEQMKNCPIAKETDDSDV